MSEEGSPPTTAYISASEDSPTITIEAVATPPYTTSPALDYGEWPLLTDYELCTLQHILTRDPVPAHIPLLRTVPVGMTQALFNHDLEPVDWVVQH